VAVVQRQSIVAADGCDYADAFHVELGAPDSRSAEEVFLAGLAGAPQWLRVLVVIAHRYVLRFQLAPLSAPNHLLGWEILSTEPDCIRLGACGPLMDGILVGRRLTSSSAALETFVTYRRPVPARIVWTAVAPIHRAVAPYLLRRAATASGER
jgi:hypothetical protein